MSDQSSDVVTLPKKLTPPQLAEWIGVDVATLAGWRSSKKHGPAFIKLSPKAVRYDRAVVQAWLDERTKAGSTAR